MEKCQKMSANLLLIATLMKKIQKNWKNIPKETALKNKPKSVYR